MMTPEQRQSITKLRDILNTATQLLGRIKADLASARAWAGHDQGQRMLARLEGELSRLKAIHDGIGKALDRLRKESGAKAMASACCTRMKLYT
ncbi:hypothetical protein D5125_12920 [Magnetovirga frankeli]|uniref:hypothetical protein n=1 Tax=Magnetovirga frankeli TaxID=947516 RepID=UPI001293CB4D|nr:hypothetical protein D5125_12920 [gamma proteobacterium SS-5]